MALVRTGEDVLFQRAVFLIIAHDLATQAGADPHANVEERDAAKTHVRYCAGRLRRIDALLKQEHGVRLGYLRWVPTAIGEMINGCRTAWQHVLQCGAAPVAIVALIALLRGAGLV